MARLQQTFDATKHNPAQSSGSLPIGKHPVKITDSLVKATKNNDGGYLELTLTIMDGPMTGTSGPYRLNLYNQNQTAVEIAQNQLSAICHVTGVYQLQDSNQLHNIPFIVEVGPQKADLQYTEVKKVYDINGNEPGKQSAPQAQPQQPFGQPVQQPYNAGNYSEKSGPDTNPGAPQQPAWGQPAPQQAPAWGGQQQPQEAPQQNAPAWGNQANQQQPQQPQQPAWGQPAPQQQPQQPQQAPAWGSNGAQAPWGR